MIEVWLKSFDEDLGGDAKKREIGYPKSGIESGTAATRRE
jgi:hypothetical protein